MIFYKPNYEPLRIKKKRERGVREEKRKTIDHKTERKKARVVVKKRFLGHHQKFQKVYKIPSLSAQNHQNSSALFLSVVI